MLEIRPNCENCGKSLPYNSTEAMICSFECTFCAECVEEVLENVCPNCGGNFSFRPIRPKQKLEKYPVSLVSKIKVVNKDTFEGLKKQFKDILPENR